jgi:hypothetical protein
VPIGLAPDLESILVFNETILEEFIILLNIVLLIIIGINKLIISLNDVSFLNQFFEWLTYFT